MAKLAARDQQDVELARSYQRVFLESEDGRAVLRDLLKVSLLFTSALDITGSADLTLVNAGRQSVGAHIRRRLFLTEDQLLDLAERKERHERERERG